VKDCNEAYQKQREVIAANFMYTDEAALMRYPDSGAWSTVHLTTINSIRATMPPGKARDDLIEQMGTVFSAEFMRLKDLWPRSRSVGVTSPSPAVSAPRSLDKGKGLSLALPKRPLDARDRARLDTLRAELKTGEILSVVPLNPKAIDTDVITMDVDGKSYRFVGGTRRERDLDIWTGTTENPYTRLTLRRDVAAPSALGSLLGSFYIGLRAYMFYPLGDQYALVRLGE
jgi:hypothetical protein